ncbi:hypothetical protein M422DRAFT_44606 [Sphaerobolus stellatus SS14]|nr:hypothetical protein M422DRAFT_44606 [Sphaerobolus stellatus SS14]
MSLDRTTSGKWCFGTRNVHAELIFHTYIATAKLDKPTCLCGQKLFIKFLHHRGNLAMILTDGHTGQALGLDDALIQMNDPKVSLLNIRDAAEIIQSTLQTCDIHCVQ